MRLDELATPVVKRLRSDSGFGLIELLVAMVVTMIAVMALVAALTSSNVALVRASRISTSAAIASAQLERYRAIKYPQIQLSTASVGAADATYIVDPSYVAADTVKSTSCADPDTAPPDICLATQTVTGPDGRSYRLDTFIVYETPPSGRQLKKVTVVVRDGGTPRVRETSAFDEATGS